MSNNHVHPSDANAPKRYNPLDEDPKIPEITEEGCLTFVEPTTFASGGFADVYKGHYRCKGSEEIQEVAVKALRLRGTTQDALADYREDLNRIDTRLAREMFTWKRLDHPRITPLLGYARSGSNIVRNDRPILISPYRKNSNLHVYLSQNPDADKFSLLRDVCDGLDYLHNFDPKIVHLDLKPRNILIGDDGKAELNDFGLSKTIEDGQTGFTTLGNIGMSLGYTAPEVMEADSEDMETLRKMTESDIYSLRCVMVETFSGVPPWGPKPNVVDVVKKVTKGKTPVRKEHAILGYSEAIVDGIWELMPQCWERDPQARPNADSVKASLIQIQQTHSSSTELSP